MPHQVGKHKKSCLWCFCLKFINKQTAIWCNKHKWERIINCAELHHRGQSLIKDELMIMASGCPNFDSEEYPRVEKERFR